MLSVPEVYDSESLRVLRGPEVWGTRARVMRPNGQRCAGSPPSVATSALLASCHLDRSFLCISALLTFAPLSALRAPRSALGFVFDQFCDSRCRFCCALGTKGGIMG